MNRSSVKLLWAAQLAIFAAAWPAGALAEPPAATMPAGPRTGEVDWPMRTSPELTDVPAVGEFHPRLLDLWLEALARPDAETRRLAADAIAEATPLGLPNPQRAAAPLLNTLQTPGQHALVRLACARALIAMDHRPAAPALLAQSTGADVDILLLVDPALARWRHEPARAAWLARLEQPDTPRSAVVSALESLASVGEPKLAAHARKLIDNRRLDPALRLTAARALATVSDKTAEQALRLSRADNPLPERLIAASLLAKSDDADARKVLLVLAQDAEPAVQAIALRRIIQIDARLLEPQTPALAASRDANVRALAVAAMKGHPTAPSVPILASLLDDPNPKIRAAARDALIALHADKALRPAVQNALLHAMREGPWRPAEQAALAAGSVGEHDWADAITSLLPSPRREVRVAAAVAIRRLNLQSATAPALAHAKRLADSWKPLDPARRTPETVREHDAADAELAQFIQTFGSLRAHQTQDLLLQLLPKTSNFGPQSREAACWATGMIIQQTPSAAAATSLADRAADANEMIPELTTVRAAATIALGRTRDPAKTPALRRILSSDKTPRHVKLAARWALHEITGQWPDPLHAPLADRKNWFLEPIR